MAIQFYASYFTVSIATFQPDSMHKVNFLCFGEPSMNVDNVQLCGCDVYWQDVFYVGSVAGVP